MSNETWSAVDDYYDKLLIGDDEDLKVALKASDAAELPEIQVAANQGKMLMLLAQIQGAKNILEIGTLGGYSTIWMARALPEDGRIITLEYEPKHAEVAQENIARAGFADQVEVRVGLAVDNLAKIEEEGFEPFDLIFIDADKPSNPEYIQYALKFSRSGTLIIADNIARGGAVVDADTDDESVQGIRQMNEFIANEPRFDATAVQTVGSKGYDGFMMIVVR